MSHRLNLLGIKSANEGAMLGNGRPFLVPIAIIVCITVTYIHPALRTEVGIRRVYLASDKDAEGRKETSCFLVCEHIA